MIFFCMGLKSFLNVGSKKSYNLYMSYLFQKVRGSIPAADVAVSKILNKTLVALLRMNVFVQERRMLLQHKCTLSNINGHIINTDCGKHVQASGWHRSLWLSTTE